MEVTDSQTRASSLKLPGWLSGCNTPISHYLCFRMQLQPLLPFSVSCSSSWRIGTFWSGSRIHFCGNGVDFGRVSTHAMSRPWRLSSVPAVRMQRTYATCDVCREASNRRRNGRDNGAPDGSKLQFPRFLFTHFYSLSLLSFPIAISSTLLPRTFSEWPRS